MTNNAFGEYASGGLNKVCDTVPNIGETGMNR